MTRRPAVLLTRTLRRRIIVCGVELIMELTPTGELHVRGKQRRREWMVTFAELFPHAIAQKGGFAVEQIEVDGIAPKARPVEPQGEPT